jgi:hypothetical protein
MWGRPLKKGSGNATLELEDEVEDEVAQPKLHIMSSRLF